MDDHDHKMIVIDSLDEIPEDIPMGYLRCTECEYSNKLDYDGYDEKFIWTLEEKNGQRSWTVSCPKCYSLHVAFLQDKDWHKKYL